MTDHAAEGQQDERTKGLARESALRTQVAELKDSLAAALDWSHSCPGCGWSTRDARLEQHTCPTPASEMPGPGEGDLRGEVERLRADVERLEWQSADAFNQRDAAVEQRTLAEQKVARLRELTAPGHMTIPDWQIRKAYAAIRLIVGHTEPAGESAQREALRAALADPEADR